MNHLLFIAPVTATFLGYTTVTLALLAFSGQQKTTNLLRNGGSLVFLSVYVAFPY